MRAPFRWPPTTSHGSGDELPVARSEATFRLFGVDVRCFVLDDGERIIEKESFERLMEALASGETDVGDFEDFERWRTAR